jgi:type I restriction enzyme, S subunit
MNLNNLLSEFNVVINTTKGLTELRSLILGLAVRGKLVPQDPNDEPASELLKKVGAEKERLYEEGEIRKPKKLKAVSEREIPFNIPDSWRWCRLGEIYGDIGTTNPEAKFSYIDVSSIDNSTFEIDYSKIENISAEDAPSRARRKVKEGSVIYSTVRPYLMNVAIVKNSFEYEPIASTAFEVINVFEGLLNKYVFRYLLSDPFLDYVNFKMVGVAYPAINKSDMQSAIISIPPTDEQHRIVQKIESLFAEVDELEAKLNRQTKLDEKLQIAVNADVQQAPDAETSKSTWSFHTSNFDTLYHTPEAIDNLKKNILNEAVRGRLVPQNPNDEPASELLKKIDTEKQRLYEKGKIRKPKKLPLVDEVEVPFEIPESWEWSRVETIGLTQTGTTPKTSQSEYYGDFIPFVGPGDMSDDRINYSNNGLSKTGLEVGRLIPEGSILMVCIGGSIGKCHIVDRDVSCNQQINTITPIAGVNGVYIKNLFKSDYFQKSILSKSTGSATPIINRSKWGNIPFSLPPLEEQHRIARRIEELFAICDRFKAQLEQREKVNERLVKGLVGEVLEGSSGG